MEGQDAHPHGWAVPVGAEPPVSAQPGVKPGAALPLLVASVQQTPRGSLLDSAGKPEEGTRKPPVIRQLAAHRLAGDRLPYPIVAGHTPASSEPGRLTGKKILVHTHLVTGV